MHSLMNGADRDNEQFAKICEKLIEPLKGSTIKLADDINVSLVKEQVELGVAVRMACLKIYCK